MMKLDFLEDYFVKIHKNFGICSLNYADSRLSMDGKCMRNMVFASDDFNSDYEMLLTNCSRVYGKLQRDFSLKIKRDFCDNYVVFVA